FLGSSRGGRGAEIVGVVGDTLNSARNPAPAIRYSLTDDSSYTSLPGQLALRLGEGHSDAAVSHLAATWEEFMPGRELHWRVLNEDLQRVYAQELRQMRFFNGAAAVGLLIACLGLHALAALSTQQRAQEISVRKVLGGRLFGIVLLLTLRFSGLVLLANLLAWPLAWFAMQRWLAAFTYRIELGLPLFLL